MSDIISETLAIVLTSIAVPIGAVIMFSKWSIRKIKGFFHA
ncbi:MAG: hypothetical protein ACXW0T_08860 [Methylobacter sp.]